MLEGDGKGSDIRVFNHAVHPNATESRPRSLRKEPEHEEGEVRHSKSAS